MADLPLQRQEGLIGSQAAAKLASISRRMEAAGLTASAALHALSSASPGIGECPVFRASEKLGIADCADCGRPAWRHNWVDQVTVRKRELIRSAVAELREIVRDLE